MDRQISFVDVYLESSFIIYHNILSIMPCLCFVFITLTILLPFSFIGQREPLKI